MSAYETAFDQAKYDLLLLVKTMQQKLSPKGPQGVVHTDVIKAYLEQHSRPCEDALGMLQFNGALESVDGAGRKDDKSGRLRVTHHGDQLLKHWRSLPENLRKQEPDPDKVEMAPLQFNDTSGGKRNAPPSGPRAKPVESAR